MTNKTDAFQEEGVRKDQNCDTDKIGRQAVRYSTKTERQALGHRQEMTEDRKTSGYEARSVPSVTWHPDVHILNKHRIGSRKPTRNTQVNWEWFQDNNGTRHTREPEHAWCSNEQKEYQKKETGVG